MRSLVFAFSLLFVVVSSAFQVPRLTGPVVDLARLIPQRDEAALDQLLRRVNQRGELQLQILTVPSLEGESIEQASIQVVDQWKLGTAEKDNGVLLFVARDDRQVRIEVGQGLEGTITDLHASRIIRDTIVPMFRSNEFAAGIKAGVLQIIRLADPHFTDQLTAEEVAAYQQTPTRNKRNFVPLVFYFLILMMMLISGRFRAFALGYMLGGMGGWRGHGHGGGGGFGGGGWSGGGGGFSGGGASGRW